MELQFFCAVFNFGQVFTYRELGGVFVFLDGLIGGAGADVVVFF